MALSREKQQLLAIRSAFNAGTMIGGILGSLLTAAFFLLVVV